MHRVAPKVFLIGETRKVQEGLDDFFRHLGVEFETDAASDAEELTEIAGKSCYLSFDTKLNKNLTKVGTRTNHDYNQNIASQKHGSVFEHTTVNFAFVDVSRIVTHELVRHRAGFAFSQVSGRYVRADDIGYFVPSILEPIEDLIETAFQDQEYRYRQLEEALDINGMTDFAKKKEATSALRRILGNGMANHIIVTGNHRAWRHAIEMRTGAGAEEEIRVVFAQVFGLLYNRYPSLYADATSQDVNGIPEIKFAHSKI